MYEAQTSLIFAADGQQLCQGDSPVSPYLLQVVEKAKKMKDGCGMSLSDLSESVNRLGLLQKMSLDWLQSLNTLESSPTWKMRVTPSRHSYYLLLMSAPRTSGKERLLLPTPAATDWKRSLVARADMSRKSPGVPVYAAMIQEGIFYLPTPCTSQIHKIIRPLTPSERGGGGHGVMLIAMVGKIYPSLIGKRIHPNFVEWMMGFPEEWTNPDCKLSAMQLCRESSIRSFEQLEKSKREN